jgi:hypothetical protein
MKKSQIELALKLGLEVIYRGSGINAKVVADSQGIHMVVAPNGSTFPLHNAFEDYVDNPYLILGDNEGEEQMKEKFIALQLAINLRDAHNLLNIHWFDNGEVVQDLLSEMFPYNKSLDDLNLNEWIDTATKNLLDLANNTKIKTLEDFIKATAYDGYPSYADLVISFSLYRIDDDNLKADVMSHFKIPTEDIYSITINDSSNDLSGKIMSFGIHINGVDHYGTIDVTDFGHEEVVFETEGLEDDEYDQMLIDAYYNQLPIKEPMYTYSNIQGILTIIPFNKDIHLAENGFHSLDIIVQQLANEGNNVIRITPLKQ